MNSFDYIVRDSSVLPSHGSRAAEYEKDTAIRIGIVRKVESTENGPIYSVEVLADGKIMLVGCVSMVKWGGAHNFEECGVRPWLLTTIEALPPQIALSDYATKSGDVVVVAFLNGKSREGIILGSLMHGSRKPKLKAGDISYLSEFNGIETSIKEDGSYKVTFKGYTAANLAALKLPPKGVNVSPPLYNPLTGGSYFGFSDNGSYVASDGSQFIKIHKNLVTGSVIIKSGSSQLELGGNPAIGNFSVKTGKVVLESTLETSIKAQLAIKIQATVQVSMKAQQIAIGNDQFELIDGLGQLIDALGTLVVTSPVGTCTPLMSAPTWAAQVLPLKIKLALLKGSLKDGDSFKLAGNDDIAIKSSAE